MVAFVHFDALQSVVKVRSNPGREHTATGGGGNDANWTDNSRDERAAGTASRVAVSTHSFPFIVFFLTRMGSSRDYFAAVLRTHQSFVAPAQGKLLNYVERVPLGVVAQITVSNLHHDSATCLF